MDPDYQIQLWLDHVIALRGERLTTERGDGLRHRYYWYDHTSPVIRDGRVVDNGCPLPRSGALAHGLAYEWSPHHQAVFEATMAPLIDFTRWDLLVDELGTHWPNSATNWGEDTIPWLEVLAPGSRPTLHQLGLSRDFRGLRTFPLYTHDDSPYVRPIVLGDSRVAEEKPERSSYRAGLIAARGMVEWFSTRYDVASWGPQTCAICQDLFWPNALDASDLSRVGFPRYCGPCIAMTRRDVWMLGGLTEDVVKPILVSIAQEFLSETGVFPHAKVKDTVIAGLPDSERDVFMRMLILIPRSESVKPLFGSWQEYLHVAGLLEQAPRKGMSGYITVANDGHVALSVGERLVCDWLDAHSVDHDKEPLYPQHQELNPGGKMRADWLVGDCWVELAGRMDDPKYAQQMHRKQQLAHTLGLRHLVLLPAELSRLDAVAQQHWGHQGESAVSV